MKKFIYGAMSFGLLFTACSSDNLMEPTETGRRDVDRTYYLNVSIHGDSDAFTRGAADNNGNPTAGTTDFADGIDNGNYKESEVTTVYFVFYDKDGNVVGDLVQANDLEWTTGDPNNTTVEKYGQTIVQIDVPKTSGDPASVICYINPIAPQSLQFDLNSIQTVLRDKVWRSEFGFAMSNSVYYPNTSADKPTIAVEIKDGQLKNTFAEAEADTNAAIDIYVERYAAKLSFKVLDTTDAETGEKSIQDYTTTSPTIAEDGVASSNIPVSLHFNQLRWALNAEAKNTYMIKSFREEAPETGQILADNYTFGELNNIITSKLVRDGNNIKYEGGTQAEQSGQWKWNAPAYHRSYWGMSPAYFTSDYPEVASDVNENSLQVYYTYNDLNEGTNKKGYDLTTETGYFKETTVGSIALTSKNPKAAVASVILTGKYDVTVNGKTYQNTTFYTYNKSADGKDLVYFEDDGNGESQVDGAESMVARFIAATSVLYVKDAEGNFVSASKKDIIPYVEIGKHEHGPYYSGTSESSENLKISSRLRTLVLKSDVTTATSKLYVATGDGYKSIIPNSVTTTNENGSQTTVANTPGTDEITLDMANENIYQQVGSCAKYENGMAYFNIPVMHYGWYRSENLNKDKALKDIEWSDVHVGDFGVVRNHSYKIEVSELKGLGTAIADPNDPIVPPADTESYYVKYRVNILKWAVVPTQTVKL